MMKWLLSLFFMLWLVACGINGCSSKKDEQNKNNSDSNSAESNVTVPKSEDDMNSREQTKEGDAQSIKKSLQSQQETKRPLKCSKNEENINKDKRNETVKLAYPEDKTMLAEESPAVRQDNIVKDAEKAMGDEDPEVRLDVLESLVDSNLPDSNVLPIVIRGLKDEDEQVREEAVKVLSFMKDSQAGKLLVQALDDTSENVRRTVLEVASEQEDNIRWDVFKAGIVSPYEDVKEDSVATLIGISAHNTIDILIVGLKDSDAEFRNEVSSAINLLISKEFDSYEVAKKWWDANRDRYDKDLWEKDE